ncbi:MAG: thioredoxin family protein [bacterium]|nr:thioredoxin family protein [bacterium]
MVLITQNACQLKLNDPAPDFSLPGVDGKSYSLHSFKDKKILVIFFSCNHCPYVQGYEDRIIALQKETADRSVQFVAINANDAKNYPGDSFEQMVVRAKEKKYKFPYLRDESQAIARKYDAACTPEFYAFDAQRRLQFHGRLDDSHDNPKKVKKQFLRDALEALLDSQPVSIPESHPIGCSIKWL